MSRLKDRVAKLRSEIGVQKSDRQKMIFFAVAFIILVGAVIASSLTSGSAPSDEPDGDKPRVTKQPVIEIVPDPGDDVAEAGEEVGYTPNLALNAPQLEPERFEIVRDSSRAEQEIIEEEPLAYLLSLIHHKIYDGELSKRSGRPYAPLEPKKLMESPEEFRGQAFDFRATFLGGTRIDVTKPPGIEDAYRGFARLIDGDGSIVSFTLTATPDAVEPGSVIRVRGLFLKIWYASPPDETTGSPTLHFVASHRTEAGQFSGLVPSFLVESPTEIDPAWFEGPFDIGPNDSPSTPQLFRMLAYMKSFSLEDYREKRASGEIPLVDIETLDGPPPDDAVINVTDHFRLLTEDLRGHKVRISGSLLEFAAFATAENQGGFERIYHGLLEGRRKGALFVTPFHPEKYFGLKREPGMRMAVEGYLWARREYVSQNEQARQSPMIIVTDVYEIRFEESILATWGPTIVYIAVGILALAIVVFLIRDRRDTLSFQERRRQARRRHEAATIEPPRVADAEET